METTEQRQTRAGAPSPGASIYAVPLSEPFPVKNRQKSIGSKDDKFRRTLSAIAFKASPEHKKSTCK